MLREKVRLMLRERQRTSLGALDSRKATKFADKISQAATDVTHQDINILNMTKVRVIFVYRYKIFPEIKL
jgi:hypothetical protein